jgi:hypothetical protein
VGGALPVVTLILPSSDTNCTFFHNNRDKENICKTVTRSFTDELLLYQSAMQDFKNELKESLTKKVQSIKSDASEDYIDLSFRSESS